MNSVFFVHIFRNFAYNFVNFAKICKRNVNNSTVDFIFRDEKVLLTVLI